MLDICHFQLSRPVEWTTLRIKWKESEIPQSCLTLCNPMDYTVRGILQAKILERVAFPFPRRSSQPRDQTQVSHVAGRFFTTEPQGKPKNTEMDSLSLLQRIFPTQELNWGLLHCRQILYQLSYQGSPVFGILGKIPSKKFKLMIN